MTRRGEGEAQFEANGVVWKLRFDLNAIADFAAATGREEMPLEDVVGIIGSGRMNIAETRILVRVLLLEHHPDVTERDAGRVAFPAMQALGEAIASGVPVAGTHFDAAEDADTEKTKAAASRAA